MRKLFVYPLVMALTFLVGASTEMVWSSDKISSIGPPLSVAERREDEWHRLFEAAGMTGDPRVMTEVSSRLLCTNRHGVADAVPVEWDGRAWTRRTDTSIACQERDRTVHMLGRNSDYGQYSQHILETHAAWSLRNLEFTRTIVSPNAARLYVSSHEWPSH